MPIGYAAAAVGLATGIKSLTSGGAKVSSNDPGNQSTLDPRQNLLFDQLTTALQQGPGNIFPQYQGQVTTPLSNLQNVSLAGLEGAVPGASGAAAGGGALQSQGQNTLASILGSQPTDLTSYFKTNVFDPLNQTFQGTTLPSIMSALGGSAGGPQSTASAKAVTDATNQFEQTLASTQGNLALQQGQLNTQNKLTAAGQVPGMAASPITSLLSLLSAGAVPTQQQQSNQQQLLNLFNQNQNQTQTGIVDLLNAIFGKTTTPNNTVVTPGFSGGLNQQGASSIGNLLGGLFNQGGSTPSFNSPGAQNSAEADYVSQYLSSLSG